MLSVLVAFCPSLLLMLLFYSADRYEPEPRAHIAAAVGLGALAMAAATALVPLLAGAIGDDYLALGGLGARVVEAFVLEGMAEEALKFVMLAGVVYRWQEFDEPLDGVIYGVAVALGFGTVENLRYVLGGGVEVGLLRGVFAVPEHALLGATMGAFLGKAKLAGGSRGRRLVLGAAALVVPSLLHGAYDLVLLELVGPAMYVVVGLGSAALWLWVLARVRRASDASPFRPRPPRG